MIKEKPTKEEKVKVLKSILEEVLDEAEKIINFPNFEFNQIKIKEFRDKIEAYEELARSSIALGYLSNKEVIEEFGERYRHIHDTHSIKLCNALESKNGG